MVKFTLSTLSALALVLPFADLPSATATHTNGLTGANAMRRHHARMATGHANYERELPRNAVLAKKMEQKKPSYRIKKRGDGSVCKIRGSSSSAGNSTSTVASSAAQTSAASTLSGASAVTSGASSVFSSVLPSATDATSTFVGDSWAAASSSSAPSSSAAAVSSSQAPAASSSNVVVASSTSTSAAAAKTSTASSSYSGSYAHLIPNGKKAGISAGDSFDLMAPYIGSWYDWTPNPQGHSAPGVTPMSMIWGAGSADGTDAQRLQEFKDLSFTPAYIIGYEEPDCPAGSGSAGFDVGTGISLWNELVGPKKAQGSILVSPSMCKQVAESGWLGPFLKGVDVKPDIIGMHINKNSREGIMADLDHYAQYGLPLMVDEFACVDDSTGFVPCENQDEIDNFIHTIVDILENDERVVAYHFSSGIGLGGTWKLMASSSGLSATGQTYLNAISKYH